VGAALTVAGIVWVMRSDSKPAAATPPVVVAPQPVTVAPPAPAPQPTVTSLQPKPALATQPAMNFAPEVVDKHEDVLWVFHVVPKNAEITVENRRVTNGKLTLPFSKKPLHVHVAAPGYQPISTVARPTTSQTFELQMTRLQRSAPSERRSTPAEPKPRVHDAAPVQDL
jgi:hypothetical protein